MTCVAVGHDEVDGMLVVEMIELETVRERGQVPFKEIDEDSLARLEHGAEMRRETQHSS